MSFVLLSTAHGPLIVNTNDFRLTSEDQGYGVGAQLFSRGRYDPFLVGNTTEILRLLSIYRKRPILAVDAGANLGVMTVEWARATSGGAGRVIAVEPQRRLFQALCGNVALNNLSNVLCLQMALSDVAGYAQVPMPDYGRPGSFGSLPMRRDRINDTGQETDETRAELVEFQTLDEMFIDGDTYVDFVKLDVEGMELEALRGGINAVSNHHPVLFVEHQKSSPDALNGWLTTMDYRVEDVDGHNLLAVHPRDAILWDHASNWRWK